MYIIAVSSRSSLGDAPWYWWVIGILMYGAIVGLLLYDRKQEKDG